VFEDARTKITDVTKDDAKYTGLLKKLVLQVRTQPFRPSTPLPAGAQRLRRSTHF